MVIIVYNERDLRNFFYGNRFGGTWTGNQDGILCNIMYRVSEIMKRSDEFYEIIGRFR
jgi:hypothetical protein